MADSAATQTGTSSRGLRLTLWIAVLAAFVAWGRFVRAPIQARVRT